MSNQMLEAGGEPITARIGQMWHEEIARAPASSRARTRERHVKLGGGESRFRGKHAGETRCGEHTEPPVNRSALDS